MSYNNEEEFTRRAEESTRKRKGENIRCPYCEREFKHNGKLELQQCPDCGAKLVI